MSEHPDHVHLTLGDGQVPSAASEVSHLEANAAPTEHEPPFARGSWQHAVDDALVGYLKTSEEFDTPHDAVAWLLRTTADAAVASSAPTPPLVQIGQRIESMLGTFLRAGEPPERALDLAFECARPMFAVAIPATGDPLFAVHADEWEDHIRMNLRIRALHEIPVAWQVAASFFGAYESIPAALRADAIPLFAPKSADARQPIHCDGRDVPTGSGLRCEAAEGTPASNGHSDPEPSVGGSGRA